MPHFADDPAAGDPTAEEPEMLRKLRTMLRGDRAPSRRPTLSERFGVPPGRPVEPTATDADPVRAESRADGR